MNVFQGIFILFCIVQFCLAAVRFRRSRHIASFLFMFVWLMAITMLLDPTVATRIATAAGIGRGTDLVLYVLAFLFLWAHYQHYVRYKRVENHITTLVREFAIGQSRQADYAFGRSAPGRAAGECDEP